MGATKKQEAWEEDGTDEKGSGKPGGENEGVDEDAKAEGETVLTEDGQKGRRDEEKSAAVDGKRTEKEEEEERRNEERERAMKEEREDLRSGGHKKQLFFMIEQINLYLLRIFVLYLVYLL